RSFSWQNSFCVLPLLFHTSINENINCRVVMSVELSIALLFSSKTIPSASSLKYVLYRWVTAQRIAMIYSLLACCKVNNVEPMGWLTHVLEELPKRRVNEIQDLLPQKI